MLYIELFNAHIQSINTILLIAISLLTLVFAIVIIVLNFFQKTRTQQFLRSRQVRDTINSAIKQHVDDRMDEPDFRDALYNHIITNLLNNDELIDKIAKKVENKSNEFDDNIPF